MAESPVLYVYYRPANDDAYPGVPNRHITEADWAVFSPSQRRTVEEATTQEGYTRRKVWVHRDLVDETEQERAEREAAEQAARNAYERGQSLVRYREFAKVLPGPGEVIVGSEDGPVARPANRDQLGIVDPNPGARRLFGGPPKVMATPPTIGALNTAYSGGSAATPPASQSVIANARRYRTDDTDAFRYFNGDVARAAGWEAGRVYAAFITSSSSAPSISVDFEADCTQIEIVVRADGRPVHILVDGEYISATPPTVSSNGAPVGIPLTFATRAVRRFTVVCNSFWAVMVGPTDTVWRSSFPLGPRVIVLGDSFTESSGVHQEVGFARHLGYLMGWSDVWPSGSGATGYTTNGGITGRFTFRGRVEPDVIARKPDLVIVAGGINDESNGAAAVAAEAPLLFDAIRDGLPGVPLVTVGPWSPNGSPVAARVQVRDAIRAAALGAGALFIDNIGGPVPYTGSTSAYVNTGWITGTGRSTSPAGNGNADVYTSGDGTHPTAAGYQYLARRLASAIAAAMPLDQYR